VSELTDPVNRSSVVHPSGFSGPPSRRARSDLGVHRRAAGRCVRVGGWSGSGRRATVPLPEEVVALARLGRWPRGWTYRVGAIDGSGAGENK